MDSRIYFKNDSSPSRDRTKYDIKVVVILTSMPFCQTCIMMKKCVMTSQVCHSERGSAISDRLRLDVSVTCST